MNPDCAMPATAPAKADTRPRSAVSHGVGLSGLAGMVAWLGVARWFGLDGPYAALVNLIAVGVPMVGWSLLVDKVHRNPSTGIDWRNPKPLKATLDTSLTKLAGLWLTWGAIACIYAIGRFWWEWGNFPFAMWCFERAAPVLFLGSIPYVLWIDRYLIAPKDGAWTLGAWLLGLKEPIDREAIWNHLRSWTVKGFFLAFMVSIVPGGFGEFVRRDFSDVLNDPVTLVMALINFMFLIDVAFATVGYILTCRPLDTHIRTANPFAAAWMAALICYPPFIMMGEGRPIDYRIGTYGDDGWTVWLAGHPMLLAALGAVLVALTGVYAWATLVFGLRFSNLTNRGILTHGPYAWTRHPAYLAKNLFWWCSVLPFLSSTGDWTDAVRNCCMLGCVSGVYFWRAKTEERHLKLDPAYRAYSDWMDRHAPVPRFFAWLIGKKAQDNVTVAPGSASILD